MQTESTSSYSQSKNNAVVLINKTGDVTSFSCLKYLKKYVNKKVGHCGTLDKFATGLIIACCGNYTKKVESFMGFDKTYEAEIEFGKQTDTLDPEGNVIKTGIVPELSVIENAVNRLMGNIIQIPPVFSALHVNGKRSYDLARKGCEVELKGRPVTIKNAQIISWNAPFLKIRLHVSKGTYIRSYARDLGVLCNTSAYVTKLCRTSIGPFKLEDAITWNNEELLKTKGEQDVIVAAVGVFDGLHIGHMKIIEQTVKIAKELGVKSAVFTFSTNPKMFCGSQKYAEPIISQEEFDNIIKNAGVDYRYVIDFSDNISKLSGEEFIARMCTSYKLAAMVVGENFKCGNISSQAFPVQIEEFLSKYTTKAFLKVVPPVLCNGEVVSSSLIRRCLLTGDYEKASQLLGRLLNPKNGS